MNLEVNSPKRIVSYVDRSQWTGVCSAPFGGPVPVRHHHDITHPSVLHFRTPYCSTTRLVDTMVHHWGREVRSLLRPSEHLHLILVGTALILPRTRVPNSREPSAILAVVGHMPVASDRAVEDSGRSMPHTPVLIFCAELVVKACSYSENPSAIITGIHHQQSSTVLSSHSNMYSQFVEISLYIYLSTLNHHRRT